jgi:hypothetical protein
MKAKITTVTAEGQRRSSNGRLTGTVSPAPSGTRKAIIAPAISAPAEVRPSAELMKAKILELLAMDDKLTILSNQLKQCEKKHDMWQKILFNKFQLSPFLFYRQADDVQTLNDLINVSYDKPAVVIPNKRSLPDTIIKYHAKYNALIKARTELREYDKQYCRLNNLISADFTKLIEQSNGAKKDKLIHYQKKIFKQIKFSPNTKCPSSGEKLVIKFLDKLAN